MANKITVKLAGEQQRIRAKMLVDQAPLGYIVTVKEENRSEEQNRLLWPLIADIRKQMPEHAKFSAEDTKNRFMQALGHEMRFLPELEGVGMFPVGHRSSTLSKTQFGALIELIFAYGAKHRVLWSDRSYDTIGKYR